MQIRKLLLITGNPGKAEEFKKIINIKELDFSHRSLDLPEIQSFDIGEIAKYKTESALSNVFEDIKYDAILTDDTGLYCDALNGLPGPFIKWFLDKLGVEGIYDLVKGKIPNTKAVCLLSLGIVKTREIVQFRGEVEGKLIEPKGSRGFGWDKSFLPQGESKTYGEMSEQEKNHISHRTLAVQKLRIWLLDNNRM